MNTFEKLAAQRAAEIELELLAEQHLEKQAILGGGIAGYLAQGDPKATPRSGFWRGVGGGLVGSAAGHGIGALAGANPAARFGLGALGSIAGGYLGGRTARATPEERAAYQAKQRAKTASSHFDQLAAQRAEEILKEATDNTIDDLALARAEEMLKEAFLSKLLRSGAKATQTAAKRTPAFKGHSAVLPTQAKTVTKGGVQRTSGGYDTLAKQKLKPKAAITDVPGWGMQRGAVTA